jgi:hypothetical protein
VDGWVIGAFPAAKTAAAVGVLVEGKAEPCPPSVGLLSAAPSAPAAAPSAPPFLSPPPSPPPPTRGSPSFPAPGTRRGGPVLGRRAHPRVEPQPRHPRRRLCRLAGRTAGATGGGGGALGLPLCHDDGGACAGHPTAPPTCTPRTASWQANKHLSRRGGGGTGGCGGWGGGSDACVVWDGRDAHAPPQRSKK